MAAGIKDISVEAGATFRLSLQWLQPSTDDSTPGQPYDLTGASAQMQVRQRVGSDILIDLDTDSGITLSGATGVIDILIPWDLTAELTVKKAVWDLFVTFPGSQDREKVLKGKVYVDPAVTSLPQTTDTTNPTSSDDVEFVEPVITPASGDVEEPVDEQLIQPVSLEASDESTAPST